MKFNEYKQGYNIFAITQGKDGIKAEQRKVTAVSQPYFPQMQNITDFKSVGQNRVIDLTIEANGGTKVYSFPENSHTASTPDNIVFTDREGAIMELNVIKTQSVEVLQRHGLVVKIFLFIFAASLILTYC